MKIDFLVIEARPPSWLLERRLEYQARLQPFVPFSVRTLKSPGLARESHELKRKKEAEILLDALDTKDLLILFDERGRLAKSSIGFADDLQRALGSGKGRIVFCIGGPYGFDESVRSRANALWSLSPLTMNHWIAQLMALEQIYRGFTILKGLPYHNE